MITKLLKLSVILLLAVLNVSASAETHCKSGEAAYFSCKIKNSQKIVSLCGPVTLQDAGTGKVSKEAWLQYRFGKLGKLELIYPTEKGNSLEKFKFEYARHNHGFDSTVSFIHGGIWYAVESLEGTEDEKDNFYGVEFAPADNDPRIKLPTRFACEGMPQGVVDFSWLASELDPQK